MALRYVVSFINHNTDMARPRPDNVFRTYGAMLDYLNEKATLYGTELDMRNHASDRPVLQTANGKFKFYTDSAVLG